MVDPALATRRSSDRRSVRVVWSVTPPRHTHSSWDVRKQRWPLTGRRRSDPRGPGAVIRLAAHPSASCRAAPRRMRAGVQTCDRDGGAATRVRRRPQGGPRHRPRGRPRRGLRLPRAQRGGQDDDGPDARHAAASRPAGTRTSPASTSPRSRRQVRRRIGVALQEAALDLLMTGRELMELQATLHGIPRRTVAAARRGADRARRALARRPSAASATYSGGMRRRLDLAMALIHEPEVLFLDEPTTGLDPTSRTTLWDEVRRLRDEGTTVFLTTQYLEEADQLADRVGIIDRGQLVAEGTPAALKAEVGSPAPGHHAAGARRRMPSRPRRAVAPFGRPARDDARRCHVSLRVDDGAAAIAAGRARARRGGLRGRRARARAADARRRLRSRRPAHRLEGAETAPAVEPEPEAERRSPRERPDVDRGRLPGPGPPDAA